MTVNYIKPEDVSPQDAQKVLDFLNAAKSSKEIADAVEIPNERDVGEIVASHILDKRQELGGFTDLKQVADVWQVGPERFTEIVYTLSTRETGGMEETGGDKVEETGRNIMEIYRKITDYKYENMMHGGRNWINLHIYDETGQEHLLQTTDDPQKVYKPRILNSVQVVVNILESEFPLFIDMLRNEKPISMHLQTYDEGDYIVWFETKKEPVVEEEARQIL